MKNLKRYAKNTLCILFVFLLFDITGSWLATCNYSYEPGNYNYQKACDLLGGPFISSLIWFRGLFDSETVIAAFTVILAISTIGLWRSTDKLWDAGERQIRLSRSTAAVQARNTRRQLKLSQSATERQLQAYLSIMKGRIWDVEIGKKPTVKFRIGNAGQTPAYNLWAEVSIGYATFPLPRGTRIIVQLQPTEEMSHVTISPGMCVWHGVGKPEPLAEVEFSEIANKRTAIYVFGKIRYTDAFGRGWLQNLRLMYTWRGLATGSKKLEVCEEGNEIVQESGPPLT
jgi:hypothetical protein